MDLRLTLILRIALVALLSLCGASAYVLIQADRSAKRDAAETANLVANLVRTQVEFRSIGFETPADELARFPQWDTLLASLQVAGLCIRLVRPDGGLARSSCYRDGAGERTAPAWFARLYGWALVPGREEVRRLASRGIERMTVIVAPDAETEILRAWRDLHNLLGLTIVTVLALCVLVYAVMSRTLRPTRQIVSVLGRLEHGASHARLPQFELREFQSIAEGVNRLADSLEESQAARRALDRQLLDVQEAERRHLARELHDEFGQCLAAISAAAASVRQTALVRCHEAAEDGERIARIVEHMMLSLRGMLLRLRPPGLDELGLVGSLRGLVDQWNGLHARETRFDLRIDGDLAHLPDPVNVHLFRVVQECMTNAARHARASVVTVHLARRCPASGGAAGEVELEVADNGGTRRLSESARPGAGMMGIRERVAALGGTVGFESAPSGGGIVHARIPLPEPADGAACR